MKQVQLIVLFFSIMQALLLNAQKSDTVEYCDYTNYKWKHIALKMPSDWYASEDAMQLAQTLILCQKDVGGWSKNVAYHQLSETEKNELINNKKQVGATFDNGATTTELHFLAKVFSHNPNEAIKQSLTDGLNYIFVAQYGNGGWPQFYPYRKGESVVYSRYITYNDDAMVNIMQFLQELLSGTSYINALKYSESNITKAQNAFDKGIECILNTQIWANGKPTVWCAQHNDVTLKPAKARKYELESFSGSESVKITRLLMSLDNPNQNIIQSVNGAIDWFEQNKIEGIKIVEEIDSSGRSNRIVVNDKDAEPLWARFYDLQTNQPFFCDRDGIKRDSLSQIGFERRNHYRWYTNAPSSLLEEQYKWRKQLNKNN